MMMVCFLSLRLLVVILFSAGIGTSLTVTVGPAVTVNISEDALLICNFETTSDYPSAQWYKTSSIDANLITKNAGGGFPVEPGWDRHTVIGNLSSGVVDLKITDTDVTDSGSYICRVSTHVAPWIEKHISLSVNSIPCKPALNGSRMVNGSMPFTIICQSDCGGNTIIYTIIKDGIEIHTGDGSLVVDHASKEHEGQYICHASNFLGVSLSSEPFSIIVPYFQPYDGTIHVTCKSGSSKIVVTCEFTGNPSEMDFTWYYDGIGGNNTQTVTITTLYNTTVVCRAANVIGESDDAIIIVECEQAGCALLCILLISLFGGILIIATCVIFCCRCCLREKISLACGCCQPLCLKWDDCIVKSCPSCKQCCKVKVHGKEGSVELEGDGTGPQTNNQAKPAKV